MNYCCKCAGLVTQTWIAAERRQRYVCAACGTTHYQNPRVIVRCIVHYREMILMCQRAAEPARGLWEVPSGYLECGETLEQGAARETFEETGVVIDPRQLDLYSVVSMTALEQVAISFRLALKTEPVIHCGNECLDVAFLAEGQVESARMAWLDSIGDGTRRLYEEIRSNQFGVHLRTIDPNCYRPISRDYPANRCNNSGILETPLFG